jgi:hypothetical protein
MEGNGAGLSDFCREHWPETIPPGAHRFVANVEISFMQEIFNLTQ